MDTTALTAAYRELVAAASAITEATPLPADQRADVDWTLCHVATGDRLLVDLTRRVLAEGTPQAMDNLPSMDPHAIARAIATTSHAERVAAVRRTADELIELAALATPAAERVPVTVRAWGRDGKFVTELDLTWSDVLTLRHQHHIPGHAARLAGYTQA